MREQADPTHIWACPERQGGIDGVGLQRHGASFHLRISDGTGLFGIREDSADRINQLPPMWLVCMRSLSYLKLPLSSYPSMQTAFYSSFLARSPVASKTPTILWVIVDCIEEF